jgi:short-subunit dehydrogenase
VTPTPTTKSTGGGGSSEPTAGQKNALESAKQYLETQAFSRKGLIEQLSSKYGEGYSKADATWAVDHLKVNWNEQAYRAAKEYLDTMPFSRAGLIQQLESPEGGGFTHAQAVYGATKAGL